MGYKEDESISKQLVKTGATIAKDIIKKNILAEIMPVLLPVIFIVVAFIFAFFLIFGTAVSFSSLFDEYFDNNSELSQMTSEEREKWMNDSENLYNVIMSGELDLDGLQLLNLDSETIVRIFTKIHEYNERRNDSISVQYEALVETKTAEAIENGYVFNQLDVYGNTDDDEINKTQELKTFTTIVYRGDVEKDRDEENESLDVFEIRWQPILALAAVVVYDGYEEWGKNSDVDLSNTSLKDADLTNYYLTDEQIEEIIKVFYYEMDYYYDLIASGKTKFTFDEMSEKECAYFLDIEMAGNSRTISRIPASAPNKVFNAYKEYLYNYNVETGQCESRTYTMIPEKFFSACKDIDDDFDFDLFLEQLEMLPATDDLVLEFGSDDFLKGIIKTKSTNRSAVCKSIGVIYNCSTGDEEDGGGSIPTGPIMEWDGEYYNVIIRDYPEKNCYVVKEPGCDYGYYKVRSDAVDDSAADSDGFSENDLLYVFNNCSYLTGAKVRQCPLFSTEENRKKTASTLYAWQQRSGNSISFALAIMTQEGSIHTFLGINHYNYFNFAGTSSNILIEGYRFIDYKAEGNDPWQALDRQLNQLTNNWIKRSPYAQDTPYKFVFNGAGEGYNGYWSSLSHSYCPPWEDRAFPWDTSKSSYGTTNGPGWVNNVAAFRAMYNGYVGSTS